MRKKLSDKIILIHTGTTIKWTNDLIYNVYGFFDEKNKNRIYEEMKNIIKNK
mgnify:CR=1 FL=1